MRRAKSEIRQAGNPAAPLSSRQAVTEYDTRNAAFTLVHEVASDLLSDLAWWLLPRIAKRSRSL